MAAKKETAAAAPAVSDKKKALETAMQQIEKMYGKGSIMRYGDGTVANVEAIPTGSLALDLACREGASSRSTGRSPPVRRRSRCTSSRRHRSSAARSPSSTRSTRSTRRMPARWA